MVLIRLCLIGNMSLVIWKSEKTQDSETSNKFICSRAAMFLRNSNAILNFFLFLTSENKLNTQIMNTNIKKFQCCVYSTKKKNLYTNCKNDTPKIVYNRASTWSYMLHTSCFTVWTTTNVLDNRSISTLNVNRTLVSCVTLC